jgi:type IV pilus assembly protein PilB
MAGYVKLGELLVAVGAITEQQLQKALALQKGSGKRLGTVLIENRFVTEQQIIEVLQLQLGVEYIDLASAKISPEMSQALTKNLAKKNKVVPVRVAGSDLYLAMADPLDFPAIEEVRAATQKNVVPMIATSDGVERAIMNLYGSESAAKAIEEMRRERRADGAEENTVFTGSQIGEEDVNAAPTIRLVNSVIERAVVENASDIHFEPRESEMVIRLRVDGVLYEALTVPKNTQNSVIARIKVMSGLDIAEHRIPQDGRANVRIRQLDVDLRISTLPTIFGEKVTIRLLNKSQSLLTMKGIGLTGKNYEKFDYLIHNNTSGVILIVGPTGSGKSSTMYTMLGELNTEKVNIVSLEDPVEYHMDGVNQVQINDKQGMTFASGLRSILRQDPDIISVGEIRDQETAEIAIRAAITGHLVLSTVHTNNAVSTIDRLLDMDIEPYLLSTALKGVISQRLVRRICPYCRKPYTPTQEEEEMIGIPPAEHGKHPFYRGAGCSECYNTGFKGRIAAFEILVITRDIERAIHERKNQEEFSVAVEKSGFEPMVQNCRQLVLDGVTTVQEAYRAVQTTDV